VPNDFSESEYPGVPVIVPSGRTLGPLEQALARVAELEKRQASDAQWLQALQERIEKLEEAERKRRLEQQ